ncbi:Druantia anti-phage system protein DruA [Curtobacterium flaccumfaciens pv. flaccumfaciens]|uniref:Druantia anti-phage system protein DruA n=1 Tax=Curtobacterium flaccumfaciens TaxID=2035 RepID=UPI003A4DAEC8
MEDLAIAESSSWDFCPRSLPPCVSRARFSPRRRHHSLASVKDRRAASPTVPELEPLLIWGYLAHRVAAGVVCNFAPRRGVLGVLIVPTRLVRVIGGDPSETLRSTMSWVPFGVWVRPVEGGATEGCTGSVQIVDESLARVDGFLSARVAVQRRKLGPAIPPQSVDLPRLRRQFLGALRASGLRLNEAGVVPLDGDVSGLLRRQWSAQSWERRSRERATLRSADAHVDLRVWGLSDVVDPVAVRPRIVPVLDRESPDAMLWRWVFSGSPLPISRGHGKRVRALVVDDGHAGRLIGILGLCEGTATDPVLDSWVGWSARQRAGTVGSVFAATVLGVVAPYDQVGGGELLRMLLATREVRALVRQRCGTDVTAVTTETLGASRKLDDDRRGSDLVERIGYGPDRSLHLWGAAGDALVEAAKTRMSAVHAMSPAGLTGSSRVARVGLSALGFGQDALRISGSAPEKLVVSQVRNLRATLHGGNRPEWAELSLRDVTSTWRTQHARPVPKSPQSARWYRAA